MTYWRLLFFFIIKQLGALISQIYFVMKLCVFRTDGLSETRRVPCQNKFVKLVHIVGFIIKKFVMTHSHTNVKFGLLRKIL